jgi:uncharacterized membrane protein
LSQDAGQAPRADSEIRRFRACGGDWEVLRPLLSVFLTYVLSFVLLGIYWTNHHHKLHLADRINGKILWANLHLLFWLWLVSFVTGLMGENHFTSAPAASHLVPQLRRLMEDSPW